MSEFFTHVFKIDNMVKHPNADTLSIIRVYGEATIPDSGFSVIVRTQDYNIGDLAIFLSTDALLPLSNPKFHFLTKPGKTKEYHRVTANRLRGIFSYGLIVPIDPGMQEDEDISEKLGIGKYDISEDPKVQRGHVGAGGGGADEMIAPPIDYIKYDLDGLRKYAKLFKETETLDDGTVIPADTIVAREKLHGENTSFVWVDGKFHVRSRTTFKKGPQDYETCFQELLLKKKKYMLEAIKHRITQQKEREQEHFSKKSWAARTWNKISNFFNEWKEVIPSIEEITLTQEELDQITENAKNRSAVVNKFWKAAISLDVENKTKNHQNYVFFGEKIGSIPTMNYGFSNTEPSVLFFDIYDLNTKRFLPELEMRKIFNELNLPMAPIVYEGPYDYNLLLQLAEGNTLVNNQNHIKEGLVIRSLDDAYVQVGRNFIRPVLKLVSQQYLSPKK